MLQDYYYELKVKPAQQYDLFLDLLTSLTNEAIEEDNGVLISRREEDLSDVEFGLQAFAQKLSIECETSITQQKNEDWINKYKNSIQPVEVGQFYVYPTWEEPKENKTNIIINPALSFGSGHHETTSSCLQAIGENVVAQQTLLDVGCGSGILSIAAQKLGAVVDICDTDEDAVASAKENFELNGAVFNEAWTGSVTHAKRTYDVVVANIVADVLVLIANDLKKSVKEDGILILSGILEQHEHKVQKKFSDLKEIDRIAKNEWVTLVYKKA